MNTPRPPQWSLADEGFTKVVKMDYFGNPYTAWVRNEKPDYGALWDKFKDRLNQEDQEQRIKQSYAIIAADIDMHDEAQELEADKFNEKVEAYYELQNMNHDNA